MIKLYEHNRIAYASAVSMLKETGKAAIVHPTGTGKSFIGFKLCEDNPSKTVLWLSPSEYIFKTQLENLKAAGGNEPKNIRFYTYAKLMNMSEEEIKEIKPELAVCDEYHRAGAAQWQLGVQRFLKLFPDVPILGLTATAIRYLDDQRDMSEELFDGNVASEITLGEAIVRGILTPPKYVLAAFYYAEGLAKYEKRISTMRNKAAKDAAEKYLEALRRALEQADGLDVIFDKHMTDRTGKYIVFCANKEHMDEMMEKTGEWFARIDKAPHVYSVYSEDPGADQSFSDFKADEDDTHLRLLYCIDALNEGVHVEDISGVILLRPTVSPIIYKQQIGRAMSAGKKDGAVIFDIVMNIENLYSIDSIQEEMRDALTYYRYLGEEGFTVNDRFRVVDEVHDCLELFNKLNDTLTAPWNVMYEQAKAYFKENGNLRVPMSYINASGYSLGTWISNQRQCRRKNKSYLTEERIAKLDAIGMIWDRIADLRWESNFTAAQTYYRANGHLNVPVNYISPDGVKLGKWLFYLRRAKRNRSIYLTPEQIDALENIGMVWDALDYRWEKNYAAACEYYAKNGNLDVPASYVTEEGIRLGEWVHRLRGIRNGTMVGSLSEERINRLDQIGMWWGSFADRQWKQAYEAYKNYVAVYGTTVVKRGYRTDTGYNLESWIHRQREMYRNGKLPEDKISLLREAGLSFEKRDIWSERYDAVTAYYAQYHSLDIPGDIMVGNLKLKWWLTMQKKKFDSGRMPPERRELFEKLPLDELERDEWMEKFEKAAAYYKENGDLNVPAKYVTEDGFRLYEWVFRQKKMRKAGKLSQDREMLLDRIGIEWEKKSPWFDKYRYAKKYYDTHGDLNISGVYVCEDGFRLGDWLAKARTAYQNGRLSSERIELLEKIGMTWDTQLDRDWMKRFELAKAYYLSHGNLSMPADYTVDGENLSAWIIHQRMWRRKGKLSEERIEKLSSIGMVWEHDHDVIWNRRYEAFKAYYDEHGTLEDVTRNTELKDGKAGQWLPLQRGNYRKGILSAWQIDKLNAIGMVWEPEDRWEIGYRHAFEYAEKNGNLDVSVKYVCDDGYRLGNWIVNQRTSYNTPSYHHKITAEQIRRLEKIGMIWEPWKAAWEASYALAADYYQTNGHLHISNNYVTESGYTLGMWVYSQREKSRDGTLPEEYKQKLDKIGMDWLFPTERAWEDGYAAAKEYYTKHGNLDVPEDYRLGDFALGAWIKKQRKEKSNLKTAGTNGNQISRLDAIGMIWDDTDTKVTADNTNHKISTQAMAV